MIRRSLIAMAVSAICAPRGVLAGIQPADGTPLRYAPAEDAADRLARQQFGYVSGQHFTRSVQLNEHWMERQEDGYPRYGFIPIDVYERRLLVYPGEKAKTP